MTKTQEAKAIITASYILYMIDALLDPSEKVKGSTIALKQKLHSQTRKAQNFAYVEMSSTAWSSVVEQYKDKNMRIAIFDAVETLAFAEEESLTLMFGPTLIEILCRFTLKQTYDGISKEILAESRIVSHALKDALRKVVFDNKERL